MQARRVILCGLGKVGRAFVQLLYERRDLLQERYALDLRLVAVVDIGGAALAPRALEAIPLVELLGHVSAGGPWRGLAISACQGSQERR